ncbi:hypothetical protein FJTKL_03385 [Diaporthe vaccinii]|uniref:Uncharacterized protein n=1 Tax=Diaporthe vaccinii TaxID=105482 RepID=A0ABR4F1Y1_9PEZI
MVASSRIRTSSFRCSSLLVSHDFETKVDYCFELGLENIEMLLAVAECHEEEDLPHYLEHFEDSDGRFLLAAHAR